MLNLPSSPRHCALVLLLAGLYYLSGQLSFAVSVSHSVVTLVVFAAEGFALAALLLWGPRLWLGVLLGQLLLALSNGLDWPPSLAIALINSLEALLGVWLFRRLQLNTSLRRVRDVLGLLGLIFLVLQPLSASLGNLVLWLSDIVKSADLMQSWLSWWLGNALGQLLVTPLLLALLHTPRQSLHALQQNIGGVLLSLAVGGVIFFSPLPINTALCFAISTPLLLFLAIRRGMLGASLGLLCLATQAVLATHLQAGPFAEGGQTLLLDLNIYLLGMALSSLLTAALFSELHEREHDLANAQAVANLGSWVMHPHSGLFTASAQIYQIYDLVPGSPISYQTLTERVHPEDQPRVLQAWQAAQNGSQAFDSEFRLLLGNQVRWVHSQARFELADNGRILQCLGTVQDISASKQLEQLKSDFIATVSHELRTPLTAINGAIGLINGGALGPLQAPQQDMLRIAQQNCEQLIYLINDLLDIEKLAAGKMSLHLQNLALAALLQSAVEANRSYAEQHQVSLVLPASMPALQAKVDAQRLQQVLGNLLSNAAKFSPPGSQVQLRLMQHGDMARVEVEDQGSGIAEEFQPRIFQRFSQSDTSTTRRSAGSGLGLAISKALIEQMHGQIGFHSRPGQGATFFFELPLSTAVKAGASA
jgi:signal transduction histidine kinase